MAEPETDNLLCVALCTNGPPQDGYLHVSGGIAKLIDGP